MSRSFVRRDLVRGAGAVFVTHGPLGVRGEAPPWVPSPRAACALDSADSPTPLRWVRLQENPRTKRLCDFVLNLACDKGEEQGGGVCLEHGVDAGEENKTQNCVFLCVCVVLPFPPSALRTAGFRNGSLGNRPSAPFRSNVYQPTEMAVVLHGGTVSIKR